MASKRVVYYVTKNGTAPFEDWLNKLPSPTQAVIMRMVQRVASGGAKKSVAALKGGIFEIKIPRGPGYRVYFAESGNQLIVLLAGGDKKLQRHDIKKAKAYWSSYGK